MEVSLQEEGQVDNTSLTLPWPNSLGTHGNHRYAILFAGLTLKCLPVPHQCDSPLSPAPWTLLRGRQRETLPAFTALFQPNWGGACRSQI